MVRRWLPAPVIGVLTFAAMFVWLMIWGGAIILPLALVKMVTPVPVLRRGLTTVLVWVAGVPWVGGNKLIYRVLHGPRENFVVDGELNPHGSWLVISNHQSWADILILFVVLWRKVPFPRFFLKKALIWIPLVGFICWALDMPFLQRNSRSAVAANRKLGNQDLETMRRFCEKYRRQPITVVNYMEGTRCTEAKRIGRDSPYRHLLRPKSGGLSFMLNAMGEQFAGLIDCTFVYQPSTRSKLWSFLCGEQSAAWVHARVLPIPPELVRGDYNEDPAYRAHFQEWVNALWTHKDAELAEHESSRRTP